MEYVTVSAKTVNDAITEACTKLGVTSSKLEYEVVDEGSSGFLGLGSKPVVIKACIKMDVVDKVKTFLSDIFTAMKLPVQVEAVYDDNTHDLSIELVGNDMGMLIGKRGQTLDALQYLASLVANRGSQDFTRVKLDAEDYRARRIDTLVNLAKNMASKVKRSRRSMSFEPMNPYERRIIHSALQDEKNITTHSEGEEPYRRVVVTYRK
ncbi:MAG: protein jag [Clostridium sp.]|nr:protein jag [Clostridium sp.]